MTETEKLKIVAEACGYEVGWMESDARENTTTYGRDLLSDRSVGLGSSLRGAEMVAQGREEVMHDIEASQAICDAATPGPLRAVIDIVPWVYGQSGPFDDQGGGVVTEGGKDVVVGGADGDQGGAVGFMHEADRVFFIHARTALPAANRELAEARKVMAQLAEALEDSSQLLQHKGILTSGHRQRITDALEDYRKLTEKPDAE